MMMAVIVPAPEPRQQQHWAKGSGENSREGLRPRLVPGAPAYFKSQCQGEEGDKARKSGGARLWKPRVLTMPFIFSILML